MKNWTLQDYACCDGWCRHTDDMVD